MRSSKPARRLALGVAAGLIAGSALAAGAFARPAAPARSAAANEATFGMPSGSIDHLDPALWYFASTWKLSLATCTPLLSYPDKAGAAGKVVIGGIANLPKISRDGKTYTFTIKPGLKLADGTPLTAAIEKATFDRLFGKKLASPAAGFFDVIKGAPAVESGKAKSVSGITASGNTLVIRLSKPVGSFLTRMTVPWTCPVPPGAPTTASENGKLLVDGPYVVSSYTPDRQLVLTRNPNYDASKLGQRGHLDKITVQLGLDAAQAELQIKAGQLDGYLDRLPSAGASQDLRDPTLKGRVFVNPTPSVTYLWLNATVPPFNNVLVRRAVNYAIDRNAILRVWGGPSQGQVTDQILPPTMSAVHTVQIYPSAGNVAKAKQLLTQAGVKLPISGILRTRSDAPGFAEVAQAVQAQLKAVGINVTIKTAPDSVNFGVISTPANKITMGINNWTQDYPDGDDFFGPLLDGRRITPTNNNNYASFSSGWVNAHLDRLDPMVGARRAAGYAALDVATMRRYAPWAPLFNPTWVDLLSARMTGYVYTPVYGLDLTTLRIKQ